MTIKIKDDDEIEMTKADFSKFMAEYREHCGRINETKLTFEEFVKQRRLAIKEGYNPPSLLLG